MLSAYLDSYKDGKDTINNIVFVDEKEIIAPFVLLEERNMFIPYEQNTGLKGLTKITKEMTKNFKKGFQKKIELLCNSLGVIIE